MGELDSIGHASGPNILKRAGAALGVGAAFISSLSVETNLVQAEAPRVVVLDYLSSVDTEPPQTLEIDKPFERTGNPEHDDVLAWYQAAYERTSVMSSNTPLMLDPTGGEIVGTAQAEERLNENGVEFIVGFEHPSGVLVNVYHSDPNHTQTVAVDPNGLSILFSFVLENARQLNNGYLNETEIRALETAETTRLFQRNQINLIIFANEAADGSELCVEDTNEDMPNLHEDCEFYGYMSTAIVAPNQQQVSTMAVQSREFTRDLQPGIEERDHFIVLSERLAHEFAHFTAAKVGAWQRHFTEIVQSQGSTDQEAVEAAAQEVSELEHLNFVTEAGRTVFDHNYFRLDSFPVVPGYNGPTEAGRPPYRYLPVQITEN